MVSIADTILNLQAKCEAHTRSPGFSINVLLKKESAAEEPNY